MFCFITGQNELDGKWYKDRTNWQIYLKINTSNDGQILEEYIKIADKQLYWVKDHGRNQISEADLKVT